MTASFGTLLERTGGEVFQHAWVVDDVAAAEQAMRATLGCSEFTKFEMTEDWDLRGERVPCSLSLGFARAGNVQVEIMQPLSGAGVQSEFLSRHGPGFHHLGVLVPSLDVALKAAEDVGVAPVMTGGFASVRISYLDTFPALGYYLELIEDPQHMLWATRPWRDDPIDR